LFREYIVAGSRLAESGTIESPLILGARDGRPSAIMPPAYVALVAGLYRVLGTESAAATALLQAINAAAVSIAVVFVFLIAAELGGRAAGWGAAVLTAANPLLWQGTALVWDTCLFVLGVSLTVWLTIRLSRERPRWHHSMGFGLWLGGLALLNPALTSAYPLLVLWMLTRSGNWSGRTLASGVATAVLGWALVITPWTVRDYVHSGGWAYVRGGLGLELWLGVCPEAEAGVDRVYQRRFPRDNPAEQERLLELGEWGYVRQCGRDARAAISSDPGRYARLCAARAVDFWLGTVFSQSPPGKGGWPEGLTRFATSLYLGGEVVLIMLALVVAGRADKQIVWLLGIVACFSLAYCATHFQVRYRAPIEPIMAIIVALLVRAAVNLWRGSGERGFGAAGQVSE
jgi:hypothetical protein